MVSVPWHPTWYHTHGILVRGTHNDGTCHGNFSRQPLWGCAANLLAIFFQVLSFCRSIAMQSGWPDMQCRLQSEQPQTQAPTQAKTPNNKNRTQLKNITNIVLAVFVPSVSINSGVNSLLRECVLCKPEFGKCTAPSPSHLNAPTYVRMQSFCT